MLTSVWQRHGNRRKHSTLTLLGFECTVCVNACRYFCPEDKTLHPQGEEASRLHYLKSHFVLMTSEMADLCVMHFPADGICGLTLNFRNIKHIFPPNEIQTRLSLSWSSAKGKAVRRVRGSSPVLILHSGEFLCIDLWIYCIS